MPIRGERSPFPPKPKAPTGIFSTRGKQKMDDTSHFDHKDVQRYAHSGCGEAKNKPKGGSQSLRHQKHYGKRHR